VTDFSMPAPFAHGYTFNFNQLDGIPDVMPAEGWLKDLSVSNWQGMGYGNVISTPDDLMRWLEALTDGRLLSEESNGLMHEYVKTDPDDEDDLYGLGVESKNGYIGHDGDLPGYHTGAYAKDGHLFTVIMNGDSFFGRGYEVVNSLGMLLGL
jgi:D-alanyl-D-alanine carboxypeptidase